MTNLLLAGLAPVHPGEILREDILPATRISKAALARHLRISRTHLYDVLEARKPVTARMALKLAKAFGNSPSFWTNLQATYDLAVLAPAMQRELAEVELLVAA